MIEISISNQTLQLLPQNAVFWVDQKILIVADIHIGKVATMQRSGMPIPEGAMEEDLNRLNALIQHVQAKRCLVVGDLIHTKKGLSKNVVGQFSSWLEHIKCPLDLVYGNHDRSLIHHLPESWKLHSHSDILKIGPFAFTHIPTTIEDYFVWSGHVHPQILLKTGYDQLKLRCFRIYSNYGILPAFSDFVGGHLVKKDPLCRTFVTTTSKVVEI